LVRAAAMGVGVERCGRLDIGLSDEQAGVTMYPEQAIPVDQAPKVDGPMLAGGPRKAQLDGGAGGPTSTVSGR
jgi:hypothetical protein